MDFFAYASEVGAPTPGAAFADASSVEDRAGPVVTLDDDLIQQKVYTDNFTITGNVVDLGSGVAKLQMFVNWAYPWKTIDIAPNGDFSIATDFALDGSDDGNWGITLYSTDTNGYWGEEVSYRFRLDSSKTHVNDFTPPRISDTLPGENTADEPHVYYSNFDISTYVTDSDSDLASVEVIIDDVPVVPKDSSWWVGNRSRRVDAFIGTNLVEVEAAVPISYVTPLPIAYPISASFVTDFPLDGSADGLHKIVIRATDTNGNVAESVIHITLQSILPAPTASIYPAYHYTDGDFSTTQDTVGIEGQTSTWAEVLLVEQNLRVRADESGKYLIEGVALQLGSNTFTVRATDLAGKTTETVITITRNMAPTVGTALAPVTVSRDAAPTTVSLLDAFNDPDGGQLTYAVVRNSNAGLVTASTLGNQLTLTYAAGQSGTATITIRATDPDGASVDQRLTVTVN